MKKLLAFALAMTMLLSCTAALADIHGLGSVTSFTAGTPVADGNDGKQQVNTTMCAVALDADLKITFVKFDVAQNDVIWNAKGEVVVDAATVKTPTKDEKKEDYGMKARSAQLGVITVNETPGGEWYEQAAFLEEYCIGKTLDEIIEGVAANEDHYPTGADVIVGITIHVNEFIEALSIAIENAK